MALGKRRSEQQEMWVATTNLPKSPGHVFYRKLNKVFAEAGAQNGVAAYVYTVTPGLAASSSAAGASAR